MMSFLGIFFIDQQGLSRFRREKKCVIQIDYFHIDRDEESIIESGGGKRKKGKDSQMLEHT